MLKFIGTDMQIFVERGFARIDDDCIVVNDEGLPYSRAIASLFDAHRHVGSQQFSAAV